MKLNKNERAKIRYQLYRDSGYSVKEARKLRYLTYIDISGIRINRKTGEIHKGKSQSNYAKRLKGVDPDNNISELRAIAERDNDTVFTNHGFLVKNRDRKIRGKYSESVRAIRRNVKLSDGSSLDNNQAWYFAWYMLQHGVSYTQAKKELVGNEDFEKYVPKRSRSHR